MADDHREIDDLTDYLVTINLGLLTGEADDDAFERSLVRSQAELMYRMGLRVNDGVLSGPGQ